MRSLNLLLFLLVLGLTTAHARGLHAATDTAPATIDVFVAIGQSLMVGPAGTTSQAVTSAAWDNAVTCSYPLDSASVAKLDWTGREQREMQGVTSPALVMTRHLLATSPAYQRIYLTVTAAGGHSIVAFMDPARALYPLPGGQLQLWPGWVDSTIARLHWLGRDGTIVRFRGVVYFQGSNDRTDTAAPYYAENLRRLKADARARFAAAGWDNVPWYQVVSPTWGAPSPTEWVTMVQTAQRDVTDEDTSGLSFRAEADNPLGTTIVFTDGTHPDAASSERIGVVMAQMILSADVFTTKTE